MKEPSLDVGWRFISWTRPRKWKSQALRASELHRSYLFSRQVLLCFSVFFP